MNVTNIVQCYGHILIGMYHRLMLSQIMKHSN